MSKREKRREKEKSGDKMWKVRLGEDVSCQWSVVIIGQERRGRRERGVSQWPQGGGGTKVGFASAEAAGG